MTCLQVRHIQVFKARELKLFNVALDICISSREYKKIFISTAGGVSKVGVESTAPRGNVCPNPKKSFGLLLRLLREGFMGPPLPSLTKYTFTFEMSRITSTFIQKSMGTKLSIF